MSLIVRPNFSDMFGAGALPVLEEIFRHNLSLQPRMREKLMKVVSTERDIWQSSEVTDLQNFNEIAEGTDYSYVRTRQGANKTLSPSKYGLGVSISEETIDDGKFDFMSDAIAKLAESAIDSQEQSAFDIFNNAFTSVTSWDGAALCSTSHALPSGLSFSNRPDTNADLSPSALDSALTDFETDFIRDSGKFALMKPRILLVHSSNKRYAMELIGSELKADTPNNNMNSLKGEGLMVVSSPRLSDADAWFLLSDASETGLRIVSREGIQTKAESVFDNDTMKFKSRYREKIGVTHAYGVWGTSGA